MVKRLLLFIISFFSMLVSVGQIPPGYYTPAIGLTGDSLRLALHDIIDNHTSQTYSSLLTHFQTTDVKPNGKVWDMYSDVPSGSPPYEYDWTNNCGSYNSEGDCYNREHTWPQSWFNSLLPMQSDMFHIYPTDGYVNGQRSNYPFSEVGTASWTSMNGGKLGPSIYPGYTGTAFEPIDAYKGDIARSFFYMSVRYYTEDAGWDSNAMVTQSDLNPWAVNLLLQWHQDDTVSQKEIDRNNAVYNIQNNRNPFIDHPEYAQQIWAVSTGTAVVAPELISCEAYPNPSAGTFTVAVNCDYAEITLAVYSLTGQLVYSMQAQPGQVILSLDEAPAGAYLLRIYAGNAVTGKLLLKQ
jgi:endonuclease I